MANYNGFSVVINSWMFCEVLVGNVMNNLDFSRFLTNNMVDYQIFYQICMSLHCYYNCMTAWVLILCFVFTFVSLVWFQFQILLDFANLGWYCITVLVLDFHSMFLSFLSHCFLIVVNEETSKFESILISFMSDCSPLLLLFSCIFSHPFFHELAGLWQSLTLVVMVMFVGGYVDNDYKFILGTRILKNFFFWVFVCVEGDAYSLCFRTFHFWRKKN